MQIPPQHSYDTSRALPGEPETIHFQEQSMFAPHELCFTIGRLLPAQAVSYCHFKGSAGATWLHPAYKHSSLVFRLLFSLTTEQYHMLLRARHQTWQGRRVESMLWSECDELVFTQGKCGNIGSISYCFHICYLQHYKQILKL